MSHHKQKNLCRFTRELDEKLIDLVSKYEMLYDANNKFYKDLNMRDEVWSAISTTIGKSIQDCKTRWRSLRDLYHRKKKDQKLGRKIRTPWDYMELMAFLENFTSEKKQAQEDILDDNQDMKIEIKHEFDTETATSSGTVQQVQYYEEEDDPLSPNKKFKFSDYYFNDNTSDILNLLKEIRDLTKSQNCPTMTFFDSMAKTVVQFPPAKVAEVKLKVCQIVTEMELKILEDKRAAAATDDGASSENCTKNPDSS